MSGRNRWMGAACAVVLAAGLAAPAFAGMPESAAEDRSVYADGILRKLGRGIANIATCPLHRPRAEPIARPARAGIVRQGGEASVIEHPGVQIENVFSGDADTKELAECAGRNKRNVITQR